MQAKEHETHVHVPFVTVSVIFNLQQFTMYNNLQFRRQCIFKLSIKVEHFVQCERYIISVRYSLYNLKEYSCKYSA
jgi:hypothetical protein